MSEAIHQRPDSSCTIRDCESRCHAKGLCNRHYIKYMRRGKIHPLYFTYKNMIYRCYKDSNKRFDAYGGRGIKVCDSWLNSFDDFVRDMGEKPDPSYTLDRIDGDGNYEPNNCRWATITEQNRNRRKPRNNTSGCIGVYRNNNRWVAGIRVDGQFKYLGRYKEYESAVAARKKAELMYF